MNQLSAKIRYIVQQSVQRWLVVLALVILCLDAYPQYQIPFINYSMKNGLVQNQIHSICQDQKGYIWVATSGGVSRFDSKNFRNYTVTDSLPSNMVVDLHIDRENRIWMATYNGLAMSDGHSIKTYNISNSQAYGQSTLLLEDAKGNIWYRTNNGVFAVGADGVKEYSESTGLVHNQILCLTEDTQGAVWCGTREGISVIDRNHITNYTTSDGLPSFILKILAQKNGEVWVVGGNNQIVRLDGNRFTPYPLPELCMLTDAFVDSKDRIWLATDKGLYLFYDQNFIRLDIPNAWIKRIFEDRSSNIWLCTDDGIYRYTGQEFEHYTTRNGLVDNFVECIFEDKEGNIWIGTNNGISMYGKVIFETITTEFGLPNNFITTVKADAKGNVWCSPQSSGLVKVNGHKMEYFDFKKYGIVSIGLSGSKVMLGFMGAGIGTFSDGRFFGDEATGEEVYDILPVSDNEYWAASYNGLIHYNQGNKRTYTIEDGLPSNNVTFLERDHKNRIWCSTAEGLSVFDGQTFVNYTTSDGLPNNSCTDIAIDKHGAVWLGTEDGLCKITETDDRLEILVLTTKEGLAHNSINLVHTNQSDYVWVGYVNGLNTVDLNTGEIKYYAEADGYTPMDCYMGAATTDIYGNVWFGTVAGLVKYNPEADKLSASPPYTYITDISISDGTPIEQYSKGISPATGLPVDLVLPYNQNTIKFDWIGIHFTIPQKNKYRYILEGYEKNWHEETTETFREYQLSPGTYTFKVMACNNDGVWNPEPTTYASIVIRPPWWATIAAYIAYAIVLGILILLYVRRRERALIEENRVLEEKVQQRTIEIELQKENIIAINKDLQIYQEELIVQRDMAAEQRDQIDEQRREILDSIYYAKRIQTATMPKPEIMNTIISEYFLFFKPRNVVSGDFYWAAKKGNKVIVLAGDCTGHGVPGAFMSILGISFLTEIILKQEVDKASVILDELRVKLTTILSQTGAVGEQRDGMDVALIIIDYDTMQLQYAGAYNPLYLVRNNALIEYKADKMPVGIHVGKIKSFTNNMIQLNPHDMLYIFSDGYIDQFGGEKDVKFKTKPFKQLLTSISDLPLAQQKEILITTHENWKGKKSQIDDIIVIGIRIVT